MVEKVSGVLSARTRAAASVSRSSLQFRADLTSDQCKRRSTVVAGSHNGKYSGRQVVSSRLTFKSGGVDSGSWVRNSFFFLSVLSIGHDQRGGN
jgi:hypothetical protein